ncbi:hypothetical protein RQP46_008782 [Phenoliferia psychrophenolica]
MRPVHLAIAVFAFTLGALGAAIPRRISIDHMRRWERNNTFDYVIVGGGTSGLVLANRLSETKGVKVIVVEAGVDYSLDPLLNAIVSIPALDTQGAGADASAAANILEIDWGFVTVPRETFGNRTIHYERGKTLGGSSTRNFQIYQRGTVGSYDQWEALGNEGWGWKGLKPYFDKSVNYLAPDNSLRRLAIPTPPDHAFTGCSNSHEKRQVLPLNSSSIVKIPATTVTPPLPPSATVPSASPPEPTSTATLYGTGPVSLSVAPYAQPFGPYMIGAMVELGFPQATSFNNGVLAGVQFVTSTIQQALRKVQRTTSRSSYLLQAETLGRENGSLGGGQLVVLTGALAKRIIFERGTTKAIGVVFVDSEGATSSVASASGIVPGVDTELYASKEIVVAAGAFQSPQLLMVSGVGPREELEKHGIPVVVDLAGVGQGMEDHVLSAVTYPVSVETVSTLANNVTYQNQQLLNFTLNGLGPMTNPIADVIGWERLSDDTLRTIGAAALLDVVSDDWPILEYVISPGQYASIFSVLAAPQSRGTISLRSADIADHPVIDPQWLSSPIDQAVAVAGFRRMRQIFSTSFMGQILQGDEVFPGRNVSTNSEILDFVRSNSMTVWHACSMKPRKDGGVLDSRLRVYGTTGLRVIDASSFPSLPPGHPQSTIYALAEKGSDLIKEDNRHQHGMDEGHDRPSAPDPSAEALLTPVLKRFKHDELATILASDPALASRFLRVSEPFVERQEAEKARLVEEARLEEERKDSEARRDKPEAHVAPLVDELPKRDSSEPILAQEVAEIQKRVENGIRALVAHIVDPAHGLKPESVLSRLLRLDQAMERTTPNAWEHRAVALLTWDYIGLLALAVGAQRDRLEPLERSRVASRFEGSFQVSIDWETIWHGYLHETTYVAHEKSLKEDPLNTPPQILRIPARCKVPTERSSSLLQSLPFEILAQIIKAAASDFIPHQKSEPARAAALVALRSDVLRTLAQVGRAWRPHAQRELVKKPVIRGSHGLVSFLSTINKRKLAHLVQELHLDGGRPVRLVAEIPDERRYQGYDNEHRRDKKLNMLESEADVDYAEALLRKVASEQALWTPLVRLFKTAG